MNITQQILSAKGIIGIVASIATIATFLGLSINLYAGQEKPVNSSSVSYSGSEGASSATSSNAGAYAAFAGSNGASAAGATGKGTASTYASDKAANSASSNR
ncbi:MAG TPA: hypothetical protein EYG80_00510 [Flavobacteriaceae bacterium]|nr:hypothetical protein [Flavobacteriaceae bacterium]